MTGAHRQIREPNRLGAHRAAPHGRRRTVVASGLIAAVVATAAVAVFGGGSSESARAYPASPSASSPTASAPSPEPPGVVLEPQLPPPANVGKAPRQPRRAIRPEATRPPLPETGSGEFVVASGSTSANGSGTLTTYTVEVEREVPLDGSGISKTIDRSLADPRGWTASGAHALARTADDSDIRILLTTPETTDQLCAPLDTGGRLSCRAGDLVVLNAWRWLNGAPAYAGDLRNYRRYLINHEVGHALGNGHVDCPGTDVLAPVMMQQTKGVGDCIPSPWPSPSASN